MVHHAKHKAFQVGQKKSFLTWSASLMQPQPSSKISLETSAFQQCLRVAPYMANAAIWKNPKRHVAVLCTVHNIKCGRSKGDVKYSAMGDYIVIHCHSAEWWLSLNQKAANRQHRQHHLALKRTARMHMEGHVWFLPPHESQVFSQQLPAKARHTSA